MLESLQKCLGDSNMKKIKRNMSGGKAPASLNKRVEQGSSKQAVKRRLEHGINMADEFSSGISKKKQKLF